jgi:hypothetical protein
MNKHVFKALFIAAVALGSLTPMARADNGSAVNKPFDWLINIQTEQLPRQFQYKNSQIQGVIKATVNYQQDSDPNKQTDYENLWFHDFHTLGVEKLHAFSVNKGDGVGINLTHKTTATPEEMRASGNAIAHLVLDSAVNSNIVALVTVPYASFDGIIGQLQTQNFQVLGDIAVESGTNPVGLNIFVYSNPPGLSSQLIHY